jgi:hypothetical protein
MVEAELLGRLAACLVDGRSLQHDGGAPWNLLAGELDSLHERGYDLADLAKAVRADLLPDDWSGVRDGGNEVV